MYGLWSGGRMQSLFSYTKGSSIIHRAPAGLKLLLLLAIPITLYLTPIQVCLVFIPVLFILALISGIEVKLFLRDLKPIVIYSMMILAIDVLSFLISSKNGNIITKTSLYMILRLLCAIEAVSVFFRTTSIYETTDCLQRIEGILTFGKSKLVVSSMLSLFLSFLPQIFATWKDLELAYAARGGRKGLTKIIRLLPMLISSSIKKADTTFLALLNRR